jgi:dihydrodipicolinate synthase/N-acetylneuraminate lyase
MLRGALAAAVTPLRDGGDRVDSPAFPPYVEFLAGAGIDGIFALGTTGEGVLLSLDQRRRAAELFVSGPLPVVVHCGAQSTSETMSLCRHARDIGAAAVAVVAPPYYAFDEQALAVHFFGASIACDPVPLYLYEFEARSGYAIPLAVVERVREQAPNLAGLKVSDSPWEKVEPYLLEGLNVFVGAETLIPQALEAGAAGTVSGLASAFPEAVVDLVRNPGGRALETVRSLREALERVPFIPAVKHVLAKRGLPVREHVRGPLRGLMPDERAHVDQTLEAWLESQSPAPAR